MKKMRWIRKLVYALAWTFILFTGIKIVLHGFSDAESKWWTAVSHSVTGAVFETAAPVSVYALEEKSETLAVFLMRSVRAAAPVLEYVGKKNAGGSAWQDPFYVETEIKQGLTEHETDIGIVMETQAREQTDSTEQVQETEMAEAAVLSADIFSPQLTGTQYPLAKLQDYDFLVQKFYAVSEITTITGSELDAGKLLGKDITLEINPQEPQILIYHTHSQEDFKDSRSGVKEDTIVGVGDYLAQLLTEQYGYVVYHDRSEYDVVDGVLDRNAAYDCAAAGVKALLEQYPSIEVVIDLHRDGVGEEVHLVTEINGKPTAQIMFVNGISKTTLQGNISYLENPYIEENLAFSLRMKLAAEAYYPGFTRRIMIKAYRYNMHLRPRALLVEAGAQTNTFQEVKNAMEPLAVMLHKTLSGG